jgi:cold shock protein
MTGERITGTVKFWSVDRGYGFLVPDVSGPDVFCHVIDLQKSGIKAAQKHDRVSFVVVYDADRRGRTLARDIKLIA